MNLIDTNAYLGHYAARRLRHNTPKGLLALMDRAGIKRACVSSASAISYRNSHAGNEEMWEMLCEAGLGRAQQTRLLPFAVINPTYAAWESDLQWCAETMGAKGVRIYPAWHQYSLASPQAHALAEAAARLNMLVSIPQRVEDPRQRHWLLNTPDIPVNDMAAFAQKHPQTNFIITNATGVGWSDFAENKDSLPKNYWIDTSRPDVIIARELEELVRVFGAERIVFGSCIPFCYPEAAIVRMEALRDLGFDVEKIGAGNIEQLLKL